MFQGTDGIPGQEGPRGEKGTYYCLFEKYLIKSLKVQKENLVQLESVEEKETMEIKENKEFQDWMLPVLQVQMDCHCQVVVGGLQK